MASIFGKIKNPELKKAWLEDLRSGNLLQIDGQLCAQGTKNIKARYCCLGVLGRSCQRTGLFKVVFQKVVGGWTNARNLVYKDNSQDEKLPDNLRKEIGISVKGADRLMLMNDKEGKTFKEIADWIEKYL